MIKVYNLTQTNMGILCLDFDHYLQMTDNF